MKKIDTQKSDNQNNVRKTYNRPQLVTYGSLKDLTTGGSGNASEGEKGAAKPRP